MITVWAQWRKELLSDCIASPDVFSQMVDQLGEFVVPYQPPVSGNGAESRAKRCETRKRMSWERSTRGSGGYVGNDGCSNRSHYRISNWVRNKMEHKDSHSHHNTHRERHNTHPECSGVPSIAESTICVTLYASKVLSYTSGF